MRGRAWKIPLAALGIVALWVFYTLLNFERRPWWVDHPPPITRANEVSGEAHGSWTDASVTARDGVVLRAWLFHPKGPNRKTVILMHELAGTRLRMLAQIPWLMEAGYTCLAPDGRGHGASGGNVITFGIEEQYDVIAWTDWLAHHEPNARSIYGLGNSLGATDLIQASVAGAPLHAIVADSTAIDFTAPYAHLGELLRVPTSVARGLGWVFVEPALWNARRRYGLNLSASAPIEEMRQIRVPVLLIQGGSDPFIPAAYGERLHDANPRFSELWVVPGAGHAKAWQVAGTEYRRRVLDLFAAN